MQSLHISKPCVITGDKNLTYPIAIGELKKEKVMSADTQTKQLKYLNNIVEQNHRFIKKRIRFMLGFKSFNRVHFKWCRSDAYD